MLSYPCSALFTRISSVFLGHEVLDLVNDRIESLVTDIVWFLEAHWLLDHNDSSLARCITSELLYFPNVLGEGVIRARRAHPLSCLGDPHFLVEELPL